MNAEEMMELELSDSLRNDSDAWHRQSAMMAAHIPSSAEIAQNMAGMQELCRHMQMRRKQSAIYFIKNQPFYNPGQ